MTTPIASVAAHVLVVSHQRETLRHLSRFLQIFGYSVIEAAGPEQAQAAFAASQPEMVIIDWAMPDGGARELCRAIRRSETNGTCFVFMLTANLDHSELLVALEAGVDDYLRVPLVYGELLARLRAGNRAVAQFRRERLQLSIDSLTGLPTRWILERRLEERTAPAATAVVVFDFDSFERVNRALGRSAGDDVLRVAAGKLRELAGDGALVARLEGDRFAALIEGEDAAAVDAWAERARRTLGTLDSELAARVGAVTVSAGAASGDGNAIDAASLLSAAEEALAAAKQSGRDCLARAGEFDQEAQAWRELAVGGNLFKRTVARDVMTPCAFVVRSDATVDEAHRQLEHAASRRAAVVDDAQRLVGIVSQDALAEAAARGTPQHVGDLVAGAEVASFPEDSAFRDLFEFFVDGSGDALAVIHEGAPVGLVSREDLAALIEPMTSSSETSTAANAHDTAVTAE